MNGGGGDKNEDRNKKYRQSKNKEFFFREWAGSIAAIAGFGNWTAHAHGRLVEATASEVVGDDDVGDGVKDKLNILRVGGASHVAVNLLRR